MEDGSRELIKDEVSEGGKEIANNTLGLVPFFKTSSIQIKFEFIYLLSFVIISCILLFTVQVGVVTFIDYTTKVYLYSVIGGALGGWAYSVKWFYRVIGRGKDNQLRWTWETNKFYWRISVPILSGISSLALFTLAVSNILPFIKIEEFTGSSSFGFSFLVGYFTDVIFSKLATWIEKSWSPQEK